MKGVFVTMANSLAGILDSIWAVGHADASKETATAFQKAREHLLVALEQVQEVYDARAKRITEAEQSARMWREKCEADAATFAAELARKDAEISRLSRANSLSFEEQSEESRAR